MSELSERIEAEFNKIDAAHESSEPKTIPGLSYDIDFISQALGLIPINGGSAAIAPGAITDLTQEDNGDWVMTLGESSAHTLDAEDMAELEETIKQRAEAARLIQKEAMKNQAKMQIEVMAELQSGVQPGKIVGVGGKRGFH